MAHRSFARILAPLALVGALVAIVVVVQASTSNQNGGSTPSTQSVDGSGTTSSTATASTTPADDEPRRRRRTYTVKPGDILSTVSEKTGVTVEELQELNPDLDPQALQVGQKLKLTANAETDDSP